MIVLATWQIQYMHLNALDDKVDQLVFQHGLRVEVGDQERNVVSLIVPDNHNDPNQLDAHRIPFMATYLNSLPPQDNKPLRSHSHEPSKLFTQDPLDFVGLLDRDGESDRVDTGFDEDAFRFISGNKEGLEESFLRVAMGRQTSRCQPK